MRTNPFAIVFVMAAFFMYPAVSVSQNDTYWDASAQTPTSTPTAATYSFGTITQNDNNGNTTFLSTSSASSGYTFTLNGTSTPASGSGNFALSAKAGPLNIASGGSTYIEIIVTPSSGYAVNISNINFASRSTGTGPVSYSVQRVSGSSTIQVATGTLTTSWEYKNNPVSITGATNEAITLRIYGYGYTGNAGNPNWRLDDIVITASAIVLPVTFENVQAIQSDNKLKVQWTTSSETNNDYFDVEVSKNGKDFIKIATLKSKATQGSSAIPLQYEYTTPAGKIAAGAFAALLMALVPVFKRRVVHVALMAVIITTCIFVSSCQKENFSEINTENKIFVRIAQVDIDGTKEYSRIVQVIEE